jgi:hypothetical protein
MLPVEAAGARLVFILEEKDFVNDRDFVTELDVHQGAADGVADMGGVYGLAAKDNAETNDG